MVGMCLVTWDSGRTAQVGGFASEKEAEQWIKTGHRETTESNPG